MAIAQMAKVMIVTHRSQASELLEAMQQEGLCHILNADEAMVSKDFPDLAAAAERPKDLEELLIRITKAIAFLKSHAEPGKSQHPLRHCYVRPMWGLLRLVHRVLS